jgi:hypothetical protein
VSPFMHQATSMSSCPCFFSFRPMSLRISHFPHFHLATSHRLHVPTRTMRWLVACTRALASALVYATSYLRACLFKFILFLGDIASHIPPFRRVRHSHYIRISYGMPRFSFRPRCDIGLSAHRVIFDVGEAFRAAFLARLVFRVKLYMQIMPYHALIFAHIIPVFGVLRGTLKTPLFVIFMRPIAVLVLPLTSPGLL